MSGKWPPSLLDDIRDIIFNHHMYDTVLARELMTMPPDTVLMHETMEAVMRKFDDTAAWNLPVVNQGRYVGFISKSNVFSSYRTMLKTTTLE